MTKIQRTALYWGLKSDINWYKHKLGLDDWIIVISPKRPSCKMDKIRSELGVTVFDADKKRAIIWLNITAHKNDRVEKLEKTLAHEMLHVLINGECHVKLDAKAEDAIGRLENILYDMYLINKLIKDARENIGTELGESR